VLTCKVCGFQLSSKERLERHIKVHKEKALREIAYVDPNNAELTAKASFINHNSILMRMAENKKTKKRKSKN
jgi:hypothetical protein